MLTSTHVHISNLIYNDFNDDEIKLISKTALLEGCRTPDFKLKYRVFKHTFYESFFVVDKLINHLLSRKQSRREFGYKLGIILHFITDYTCAYHSNPNVVDFGFRRHIQYEYKIAKKAKKMTNINRFTERFTSLENLDEQLDSYIRRRHYLRILRPKRDFLDAYGFCKSLTSLIVFAYTMKFKRPQVEYKDAPKIAIFTDTYFPHINGVSNTLYQYIQFLEYHNIQYILLSPSYRHIDLDREQGYNIEKFKAVKFLLYPESRFTLPSRRKMKRLLDEFQPEVIHLMTEFSMGYFGLRYAKKNHIKVVSNYSTHFTQYLKYFKIGFLSGLLWRYQKWFHNSADITFTPSNDTRDYLIDRGISNVKIFGRGISSEVFSPDLWSSQLREKWLAKDKTVLLYVGRLSPEKDLHILMKSFEKLKQIHTHLALVITGSGPMKKELESYEMEDVIFTGYQTGTALHTIYASCDVFVFPSPTETLGNVVLEAMASGLPVIGVDQGGVKENILHGKNGFLANPKDVDSFTKYVNMVLTDQQLYQKMKQHSLMYAKTKSWKEIFSRLIQNYQINAPKIDL
jgi:glycosyltransferase involved in cell wall biosynthesis